MSFWSRITKVLPFAKRKPIGYDLQGNKYFEIPNPEGGRPKRIVEYLEKKDISEYTAGTQQLPVQWTAWLSFTRSKPPTLTELQNDAARQARLRGLVTAIESREREERIRQGYLLPDGSVPGLPSTNRQLRLGQSQAQGQELKVGIAGPSEKKSQQGTEKTKFELDSEIEKPFPLSSSASEEVVVAPTSSEDMSTHESTSMKFDSHRPDLVPPRQMVNPNKSAQELRKLAEEDTRRRMEQGGVKDKIEKEPEESATKKLKPRRRG